MSVWVQFLLLSLLEWINVHPHDNFSSITSVKALFPIRSYELKGLGLQHMFFWEDTIQPKTGSAKIILDGEIKAKNVRISCRITQIISFGEQG